MNFQTSFNRRDFITTALSAGVAGSLAACTTDGKRAVDQSALIQAANAPVLRLSSLTQPVIIESIELLQSGKLHLVRTRSKDGAVGISVTNERVVYLYPLLQQQVIPFFIGKDARELESLVDGVYVHDSNYKMQGLPFWCCVAWVEFSILDMLGRISKQHVSELFGGKVQKEIPIYVASGNRDTTPSEEVEILKKRIAETGAKAVKFKVGGRMSRNKDSMPNRSEELIELTRKGLGDEMTIQADANGSYDAEKAIEIGKRLEGINAYLFEEPCPFDEFEETKRVADALTIPISGGEQESSEYRFRWMISDNILQIVQPDLHYYGGFIRATRVARMAAKAGLPITVHLSGGDTGFAEMANFCSFTPNIGRFQELKKGVEETGSFFDPPILVRNGLLTVPDAPGMGMLHSEELLKNSKKLI
jgi:L-alanine-DL-glutamate epimerase-like enolase superfamily enzyme